ncbi:hypothetical protein ASF12_10805 [Paenibacillus sp. Leaf72]|nr:hypothetical protein ASF12_10805 [Paenibacillus sp. Leaf72]
MIIKLIMYTNTVIFIIVFILYILKKSRNIAVLRSLYSQISLLLVQNQIRAIVLDYKNASYEQIDRLLCESSISEQVIFFSAPHWLYIIKKKTWKKHKVFHISSLENIEINEGSGYLIYCKKNKIVIIRELTEYLIHLKRKL